MRWIFLLLSSVTCFAAPDPTYQVTFKAFTAFGEPVGAHVSVLADPLHRRDLISHCVGLICSEIPEGAYTYSILIDETGRKVDGSAVVYRTNQVVSVDVGTPAGDLDDSTFPKVTGKVLNASDPAKVWIRLQQLFSDASVSARLEQDGSFVLEQVRPGKWMLLVLVDGKLVHSEPFTCKEKDNPPITVRLRPEKPIVKASVRPALR
jgi:hypothetical protein